MSFGSKVRQLRLEREMTLREFSILTDIDVAYLSRIERGTVKAPQQEELLDAIASALKLDEKVKVELSDQARLENEKVPGDVAGTIKQMEGVPFLLRTVANRKLTAEQIKEVAKYINEHL